MSLWGIKDDGNGAGYSSAPLFLKFLNGYLTPIGGRSYYNLVDDAGQRVTSAWLKPEQAARQHEQHGDIVLRYQLAETRYRDDAGCEVFVSVGISGQFGSDNLTYAAYRRKPLRMATHRVRSPKLPLRATHAEAQADLDAYAAGKKWERIDA